MSKYGKSTLSTSWLMTVSLLPPPCPKRLWSSAAQRVSSSMAITFLAFSTSFAVSAPLPGPISSTVSVGLMSALSMMAWHRQGRGRRVSARRQQQARRPAAHLSSAHGARSRGRRRHLDDERVAQEVLAAALGVVLHSNHARRRPRGLLGLRHYCLSLHLPHVPLFVDEVK